MRRRAWLGLVVTLTACTAANQLPADAVEKRIGSSGGSLINSDGVGVAVPPGAVTRDTTFSVALAPTTQPRPLGVQVGAIYQFGPEAETFNLPVTVTVTFDAAKLPAGRAMTDIVVMRASAGSSQFEVLPTRVVDAAHVEATTSHFSVFVPVVLSVSGTGGGAGGGTGGSGGGTGGSGGGYGGGSGGGTGGSGGGTGGGADGGLDGGSCVATCGGPALDGGASDGGADCECSLSCRGTTLEVFCSGSGVYGCACVRDGIQVGVVTTPVCPGPYDFEELCFPIDDGGVDGGVDGGWPDGGSDGGFPDGGTDGGRPDGGPDAGYDGGTYDGGTYDGGTYDGGTYDGGTYDGGTDGGTYDGGYDAGVDGGISDAGTPDSGANDGG